MQTQNEVYKMKDNTTTTNWQESLLNIQLAFAGSAGKGLNLFEALVMRQKDDKIFNDMLEKVKALANKKKW